MITTKEQRKLIRAAHRKWINILPVHTKKSFSKCFTCDFGILIFWFDTPDTSTHTISIEVKYDKTFK